MALEYVTPVAQSDGAHTLVHIARSDSNSNGSEAVLFVNGWALSHRYWRTTTAVLAAHGYTCATFDARGVGEARPTPPGASFAVGRLAEDIGAVADTVSPDAPVHLVAHSNGCLSAARWAGANPARIASLTIVNAGTFPWDPKQVAALRSFTRLTVRLRHLTAIPIGRWYMVRFVTQQPIPAEYGRILADDFATTEAPAALEAALSSLNQSDLAQYVADIAAVRAAEKPILLCVGVQDRTIPPDGMRNLWHAMPGSTLASFAPCGHFPMLEQPTAFLDILRSHLEDTLTRGTELRLP